MIKRNIKTESLEPNNRLNLTEQIKALNVTNNDFNIQKAEIEIINDIEKRKMFGNIKYKKPGMYLISIKSQTGIEAAKIFITEDTILINDRINRKIYYGSPDYLLDKYGITTSIMPVIIGDYVTDRKEAKSLNCDKNYAFSDEKINGKEIIYTVDCGKKKVVDVKSINQGKEMGIIIQFGKFEKVGGIVMARRIEITDGGDETFINISIKKVETGLDSDIKFVPGKNYEHVLLK